MKHKAICFDARMANASGIGTYIRGLLGGFRAIHAAADSISLIVAKGAEIPGEWSQISTGASIYSIGEQLQVPRAFHSSGADLLHVPHYNIPAWDARNCVVTVHDLIHLKFPEFLPSRLALLYAKAFFHRLIPKTRMVIAVSHNTKKDLIEMIGIPDQNIKVIPLGVPIGFRKQTANEYGPVIKSLGLEPGYFLYVGNLKPFKNVQRLLRAYHQFHESHSDGPSMVFVGRNFIQGFETELQRTPSVKWLAEVDRASLPSLYAGAIALAFPSLYEGFGLPPLEAMACGTPVICSNRGSLPEVVGEAAVQIDPLSVEDIADALERVWLNSDLRSALSAKGLAQSAQFSWDRAARSTLDVYEQCLS